MPRATEPRPLTKTEARRIWLQAQRPDASEPFGAGPQAVAAAVDLSGRAARPNLFIKIPGTPEGLAAIEEAIATRELHLGRATAWRESLARHSKGRSPRRTPSGRSRRAR